MCKMLIMPTKAPRNFIDWLFYKIWGAPVLDPHAAYLLEHPDQPRLPGLNGVDLKRVK